ncbi:MAG: FG-GAP-like repeat-containing protein [Acidobacteriota bacterium]
MNAYANDPPILNRPERGPEPRRLIALVAAAAAAATLASAGLTHAQSTDFLEPDATAVRILEGEQVGDFFGWVTANVGDLDGDGVEEILVPAIAFDGFSGRITLYSGADGSVVNDVVGPAGSAFGYSVASAGDVNGDSIPDYMAGGGQTQVFSGADHAVLLDVSATVGFSDGVHGAGGDLDGDGRGDLVVGSQGFGANAGRVFALSGSDGAVLWTRDGAAEGDLLGSAVGALGDVDFDGVPDVVVGSSGAGPSGGGEALILSGVDGSVIHTLRPFDPSIASVFGSFFASGAGDFDGDGVGDAYIGDLDEGVGERASTGAAYVFSGRTGRRIHYIRGLEPGEGFGLGRGIADVNGDGRRDLVIGAFNNSRGAPAGGAAYVFSGRSGALLRTMTSTLENDNFGGDAVAAGDVDLDGLPDFVVTAPGRSFVGLAPGRTFVVAGTVLPCPADLTGDGWVWIRDFIRLRYAFGSDREDADLNGDGTVDRADLKILLRDFGRCPPGFPH